MTVDRSGIKSPQEQGAQKGITHKMEHLVKMRHVWFDFRRRIGRLDENQQAVKQDREPVGEKVV